MDIPGGCLFIINVHHHFKLISSDNKIFKQLSAMTKSNEEREELSFWLWLKGDSMTDLPASTLLFYWSYKKEYGQLLDLQTSLSKTNGTFRQKIFFWKDGIFD